MAGFFIGCGSGSDNNSEAEAREIDEDVEEYSGENISPQLEDSADRFEVDTLSSAQEIEQQKENELEDGESSEN